MKITVKTEEMLKNLEDLINTPSVVGFYPEIHKKLSEMVGNLGYELECDGKWMDRSEKLGWSQFS